MLLLPTRQHSPRPAILWLFSCHLANSNQPCQLLRILTWGQGDLQTIYSELPDSLAGPHTSVWESVTQKAPADARCLFALGSLQSHRKKQGWSQQNWHMKKQMHKGYEEKQKESELLNAKQRNRQKAGKRGQTSWEQDQCSLQTATALQLWPQSQKRA